MEAGGEGKWNWKSLDESGIEETLFGYYRQAINDNPGDPTGYIRLAQANAVSMIAYTTPYDGMLVPKVKAIESLLKKALELDPNSSEAYYQRAAFCYQDMGLDEGIRGVGANENIKIEKGISDSRKAIELKSDDAKAYILLGDFYADKCRWEIGTYGSPDMKLAWQLFEQAHDKAKNPQEQARIYYSMGRWYETSGRMHGSETKAKLNDYQKAIACFDKAISLDPSLFRAYERRAGVGDDYGFLTGRDKEIMHEEFVRWNEKAKQVIEEQLVAAETMYQYLLGEGEEE